MSQVAQFGVSHASAPLRWRERMAVGSRAVGPVVARPAGRRALVVGRTRTARAAAERLLGDGWSVTTDSAPEPAFVVVVACTRELFALGDAQGKSAIRAASVRRRPVGNGSFARV